MATESDFIHIIISISILLFSAKIFAEIFQRIKQPVVLGELLGNDVHHAPWKMLEQTVMNTTVLMMIKKIEF